MDDIGKWQSILADCKASGLNQREYCRRNNLTYGKLNYWRHKVNKHAGTQKSAETGAFVRHTLAAPSQTGYMLEWPDGMKLKIPAHLVVEEVAELIRHLRSEK